MSRRLNWEPLRLSHKRKLNIKDEQERFDKGYTAHWLERAEKREARRAVKTPTNQLRRFDDNL